LHTNALTMIMSTVTMSEVLADSKCDRINKNLDGIKKQVENTVKKLKKLKTSRIETLILVIV
jgi:hypothetical protein